MGYSTTQSSAPHRRRFGAVAGTRLVGVGACLIFTALAVRSARAAESDEAFSALRANRCVEAGDLFGRILKTAPDNVDARYGHGLSHLCLGEYDAAVDDLQFVAKQWPDKTEVAFELGAALTSAGSYQEAEPWLLKAQSQEDFDGPASLLLGLGQLRLGNFDAALVDLARAGSKSPSLAAQAHYYAGVAEFRAGHLSNAKHHFVAVDEAAPTSALANEAQAFLKEIEARRRETYRLFGGLGFEYDSNVVLAPVQDLGPAPDQQADGRFVLRAGGVATPILNPNLRLDIGYSFFQSLHLELGDFNLQAHEPFAELTAKTPWGRAGVSTRFQHYLRKDDLKRFLNQWVVRPFTVVPFDRAGELEVYYRYRGRDFLESQFNQLHLDSTAHAAGFHHIVPLATAGDVAIGYQFERDDLGDTMGQENRFTYDSHTALGELHWHLPLEIEGGSAYAYSDRSYADSSRLDGVVRHDANHSATFTLRRVLTAHVEALVGYLLIINDSNQTQYEYRRHVAITALSLTY